MAVITVPLALSWSCSRFQVPATVFANSNIFDRLLKEYGTGDYFQEANMEYIFGS